MSLFTQIHTAISLIAILAGFAVVGGLFAGKKCDKTTAFFLIMTGLTSLTGFGFVRHHILPSHIVAVVALIVLAVTAAALYRYKLAGIWRKIYVIGAVISLYLNMFVLVVQAFLKIPALHTMAPTGQEFPFKVTQGWLLVLFLLVGALAVIRFKPEPKKRKR